MPHFTLTNARELRTKAFPHEAKLVDPIFATDTLTVLYGPQGSGKSQLALTLAKAVATGERFLEQFPCRQGPVVYLMIDMTEQETQERLRYAAKPELDDLPIFFVHADTFTIDITKVPLEQFAMVRDLNPALTIVDSISKIHGLDENDSNTPKRVYTALRTLVPMGGLLGLHHPRKAPQDGFQGARQAFESARGTSAWIDDAAQAWLFERDFKKRQKGEYASTLTFTKVRASEPEPMGLKFREDSLLIETLDPTPLQVAQAFLAAEPKTPEGALAKRVQEQAKCSRATAYRAAKHALEGGK